MLFILLLKPVFVFFSYFFSIIYFYFLSNETTPSQQEYASGNLLVRTMRRALGDYASGFIFYSILQTGKIPFHTVRNFIYRYFYKASLGENVIIYSGAEMRRPDKLKIGKGSIVGHHSILDARYFIEIGENVNFGHGVWLWSGQHNHRDPSFGSDPKAKGKRITVCDRVWLGPRVTVLPGCTIGEGAVVGAGAVVTKDVEPFSINAGIPAKKIGERNRDIDYVFNRKPIPFV